MKTFRTWLKKLFSGEAPDRSDPNYKLDDAMYMTFSTPQGQIVLDYLISEHLLNIAYHPETAQMVLGQHMVVRDILSRMDVYQNSEKHEVKVEEEKEGEIVHG